MAILSVSANTLHCEVGQIPCLPESLYAAAGFGQYYPGGTIHEACRLMPVSFYSRYVR